MLQIQGDIAFAYSRRIEKRPSTYSQMFPGHQRGNYHLQYLYQTQAWTSYDTRDNEYESKIRPPASTQGHIYWRNNAATNNVINNVKCKLKLSSYDSVLKHLPALIEGSTLSRSTSWSCPNLQKKTHQSLQPRRQETIPTWCNRKRRLELLPFHDLSNFGSKFFNLRKPENITIKH